MMTDLKAIIFDLDGTLVHSAPDLHAACNVMLAAANRPPITLEQTISFIGNGIEKLVERALRVTGGAPSDIGPHVAEMHRAYAADLTTLTTLFPGVRGVLDGLDLPMAICTNKPETPARDLCDALDLSRYFDVITGGDTTQAKKPDALPLLHTATMLGITAQECLYVGDSVTDFKTARNADVAFAFYTGGYQPSPVQGLRPDETFDAWEGLDLTRFASSL
ncbi:phosphoglycolate phosphatase [Litoreibacter ponti]|uniref:phosphoglycolate phosphatase n=1 Tax=Litoreibacter ponti TaxID=1510457 RepID=A0A2T6BEU1_9RHOB|nr:phosphoglycolate phosphatase [Litoreibacter ponti]PTX54585.1 phosphoglycolate phosphatase [Litoreibacter ponti]